MSRENVEIVRQPISVGAQPRRRLEERLYLRFPRLLALATRTVSRLPPRSRVRQAMFRRAAQLGIEAINRQDFRAGFMIYAEDGETFYPPGLVSVGFEARTKGRVDRIDVQRRWSADWGQFQNEPEELIDLGDQVLLLGRAIGVGRGSGAPFEREVTYLVTHQSGAAIREQIFFNHAEAVEAAGLRPSDDRAP